MANSLLKNIPAVASRKFAIKLIAALPHEARGNEIFCGNHSVRNLPDGVTIHVTSAGYGQMSTSAAIRQYLAHFCGLGYKAAIVE